MRMYSSNLLVENKFFLLLHPKKCAIICVDEQIETLEKIMKHFELSELHTSNSHRFICFKISQAKQIKHEIQQL